MRAVAYCRVSTDDFDQLNSLQNQKEHYQELFQKQGFIPVKVGMLYRKIENKGVSEHIDGIFADEGISGTKLKNREAFKYMLECAKKGEFDVIYVKNVARWARSVGDGDKTLKDLKEYGVRVIFEDGNLDSFTNEMVINMFFSVAQEESRNKSIAVQFGINKAQKKGKWNSQVPFGYRLENGYLKINNEEIEVVKSIFDMYLNKGYGTGKIARNLNQNEIKTKKGKQWSQTQICSILDNCIYTGKQINHTKQTIDVNRGLQKKIDPSDWIIIQKEELRIISDDEFKIIQEERQKRNEMFKQGNRISSKHLLSNILYCNNCGSNMKRKRRHTYVRKNGTRKDIGYEFTCQRNDMYGKTKCEHRNAMPEEYIIEEIRKKLIREKNKKEEDVEKLINRDVLMNHKNRNIEEEIQILNTNIEEINEESRANLKLYTKGIINEEQYKVQNNELQKELSDKNSEIERLKHIDEEIEELRFKYNKRQKFINKIDIESLSNADLKKVFDKIYIGKKQNGKVGIVRTEFNIPQF